MLRIQYLGHSAFAFEDGERQIAIDPFVSGCPTSVTSPEDLNPSVILLTHAHADHVGDCEPLSKRTGAPIIATFEIATYLQQQGATTIGGNFGGTIKFDGGSAKFVPAWHTSAYPTEHGFVAPGVPAGFVIRFGGKTIYFAGDTCLFSDMKLIGEEGIDIAVLPIGDHFTMGPDDAVRAVKFVEPKVVIPCHFNTFPPIQQDPNEFKQKVEQQTDAECVVLAPGEQYEA